MTYRSLPTLLRFYVAAVIAAGAAALALSLLGPLPQNLWLTAGLLLATMVFSTWKVHLTVAQGEMTLTAAVVCLAMLLDGPLAALLCAGAGALLGSLVQPQTGKWRPRLRKAPLFRTAFNVCNCLLAAGAGAGWFLLVEEWAATAFGPGLAAKATAAMAFQGVQFGVNTLGLAVALGLLNAQRPSHVWRENFLWTAPGYFASASVAVGIHALYTMPIIGPVALLFLGPLYFIYVSYRVYMDRMNLYVDKVDQDMRHIQELNDLNAAIIASLATAIDAKDRYTRAHINRVQMYAVALAEAVGVEGPELEGIRTGSLIHDIGKLGIPERILGKPGKLTPEEFRRMQDHVTIGAQILAPVRFPYPVLPVVETHHERWDGLGYPRGLKGEEIPVGGRVMAIADVFDALTSDRPYRAALSPEDALRVLDEGAGRHFDPRIVAVFSRILPEVRARVVEMEAALAQSGGAEGVEPEGLPGWAHSQISQAAAEMSATCELAQGLAETCTVSEVVEVVAERALRLLPADTAVVYLCDEETGDLEAASVAGLCAEKLAGVRIQRGEGVSGWVAETLQAQVNVQAALDVGRRFNPQEPMELSAATAVPLVQGGKTAGVLTLYTTGYSVLNDHHLGVLNILAEHAAAALLGARRFEETHELSLVDPLTGLPNSRALFHHVAMLCRHRSRQRDEEKPGFCIVMFDLDGFKGVNDSHGHIRGDELLQEFASTLRRLAGTGSLPCRYAGDEFVVVLSGAGGDAGTAFAARVRMALEARSRAWSPAVLDVSAGTACFPADGTDVRSLLAVADERMYHDKFSRRTLAGPLPQQV